MSILEADYKRLCDLRSDFRNATTDIGKEALIHLWACNPELACKIMTTFHDPERAGFWMVNDSDTATKMVPLQLLATGQIDKIPARLEPYKPVTCDGPEWPDAN